MPTNLIPTLLLYIFVVGYTPGPANIFALTCSLKFGRRHALVMWLGMLTGFIITISVMCFATHMIGEALGRYVNYIKYLGAVYILYLAWKIYRTSGLPDAKAETCTFLSGMIVQMTNAKMMIFEIAMFAMFVLPYSHSIGDLFIVSAWLLIAGPVGNLAWLLVGSWMKHYIAGYGRTVDIIMSLCLAVCACMVLFG